MGVECFRRITGNVSIVVSLSVFFFLSSLVRCRLGKSTWREREALPLRFYGKPGVLAGLPVGP